MTGDKLSATMLVLAKQMRELSDAVLRASVALRELETSRTSEDIERVRHGVQHELETARGILGVEMPERLDEQRRARRRATLVQMAIDDDPGDQPDEFVSTR